MIRYKITIEYDGSKYAGWQIQKDEISIEETIQKAIFKLSQEEVRIFGSGRTDAGVHALGQVAHFDLNKEFRPFEIMMGLNYHLKQNEKIAIIDCQIADKEFHSRFDTKLRHYQYRILNRRAQPILEENRVWHIPYELDIKEMENAASYLIGQHDFTSFRDSECQAKSPIKTIENIDIIKYDNLILINICAPSFLHHMVRNIVGTLVMAGGKKITDEKVKQILEARNRNKSGPNAPACGLYLYKVDY